MLYVTEYPSNKATHGQGEEPIPASQRYLTGGATPSSRSDNTGFIEGGAVKNPHKSQSHTRDTGKKKEGEGRRRRSQRHLKQSNKGKKGVANLLLPVCRLASGSSAPAVCRLCPLTYI